MINRAKKYGRDPLYKNSFYIMLTSVTGAGFGFIFWILAAKFYPHAGDVGIATALMSSVTFIVVLTRFGLDVSIIRFFPHEDKNMLYSTTVVITTAAALVAGAIFVLGIDIFSPQLSILKDPEKGTLFLLFLAASSILSIINTAFVALRRAEYQLLQALVFGSRILLLIPLVFLGALGIFSSFGIATIAAMLVLIYFLTKLGIRLSLAYDSDFLRKTFGFCLGNYLAGLLNGSPALILPIVVLNVLGPAETAYYYIAYAIAALLYTIPNAVCTSLLVEGSHGEALKKTVVKALKATLAILIPSVIALYLAAGFLLGLIGKDYGASGTELLKVMSIAGIPVTLVSVYMTINKIQKKSVELVSLSALSFVTLLAGSYILLLRYGLTGIGYAWLISQTFVAIVVVLLAKKNGWI